MKINTRPAKQRKEEPRYNSCIVVGSLGSDAFMRKEIRTFYWRAKRILNLSPFQARTYTFGRVVESPIFFVRKGWEIEAHFSPIAE